jgi:hypothetical protein
MLPPKRQHPAIDLRLICYHLAQVSLPNLECGALLRQSFVSILRPVMFNGHVLSFDIASFAKTSPKGSESLRIGFR